MFCKIFTSFILLTNNTLLTKSQKNNIHFFSLVIFAQ